ncbi:DUF7224 domain-containing protein [Streptomyces sp. NPDC001739]
MSFPLAFSYPFAYAVVSALAVWESGRLRREEIWAFSPYRGRYRVATHALAPVVGLAWLMLILPVSIALLQSGTFPDAVSLLPLALGMILCVAHAVIGFGVGMRVPRAIAAPAMAVVVWVLTAFSRASEPFWWRHVSGHFGERLMFGEAATVQVLLPHLLLTGGIAVGVALLWLPAAPLVVRIAMSCAVSLGGFFGAYNMTKSWGPTPPLAVGHVSMDCSGHRPEVCMPTVTANALPQVARDVKSVLRDLRGAGVNQTPTLVTDRITDGRYLRPSTHRVWRVDLTRAVRDHSVRYRLGFAVASFQCSRPDLATTRAVRLWVATTIGEERAEHDRVAHEAEPFHGQSDVEKIVGKVRKLPTSKQGEWFRNQMAAACNKAS